MSSHNIPSEDLSTRISNLRKKVGAALKAREERLSKEKKPQLPSFIKKLKEENDHEYPMAREEVHKIQKSLTILHKKLKGEGNLAAWVQSKLTRAADYLEDISNHLDSGEHNIEEECEEDDTPELRSKTITDASSSSKPTRRSRVSPGTLSRMLNVEGSITPKKKKKSEMTEELEDIQELAPLVVGGLAVGAAALGGAAIKRAQDAAKSGVDAAKSGAKVKSPTGIAGAAYGLQKRNQMLQQLQNQSFKYDGETLEERKLSRTATRAARVGKPGYDAEGKPKPKGKVRAWDMDETLMRNDPKKIRVHVKDKEGKTVQSLTNQEFNTHKLDKDKGHSFDFGEFRSSERFSKAATPNKSMVKKLKKQVRRGKPVHIVTARGSFDDQPKFAKHLRRHGIEIDPGKGKGGRHVHVHRAGDMEGSDIGEKKVKIVKGLMKKHGTSGAEMYDDAAKVHRAFKTSAKETPTQPKVKTKMVQPNRTDTTQARSFKDDLDFENILDMILEGFIDQGIVESYEEGIEVLESISTDDLYNAISESTNDSVFKINYVSNYAAFNNNEVDMTEDNEDETPYGYWKNFINDVQEEIQPQYNQTLSGEELDEEVPMNSYQKWKQYLEEAPYTGRSVGRDAMISNNIARGSRPSSTPTSTSSSSTSGPGALEKVGSTLGAKVGGFIGQNKGSSTGIPGAGTIGRVIGSNKGSTIGGRLGKTADTVVNSLRQPKPTSGGTSTRPGDGKPYADGPLWNGGGGVPKSKPTPNTPSGGYSTREGDGKLRKEPLF